MKHVATSLLLAGLLPAAARVAQGQAATFAPAATYSTGAGSSPWRVATADVNGDGKTDLLTANYAANSVGVLLGTGTGSFGAVSTFSTGANSASVSLAVADVNGDGKADLLTANYGTNAVGVLLGTGTGSFGAVVAYSTGLDSYPNELAVADLTGDGQLDVLVTNGGNNTLGLLPGTGAGTFGPVVTHGTGAGSQPHGGQAADVNADGRPDLLVVGNGANAVGVMLSTGGGTFGGLTGYPTGAGTFPQDLAVADVNGDRRPDVLVANQGANAIGVLLNVGNGLFGSISNYSTGANSFPGNVTAADVNGDGKPDAVVSDFTGNTVGVLLNTGNGTFGPLTAYATGAGSQPRKNTVADVNGDGRPDLLVPGTGSGAVSVLLNTTTFLAARLPVPGVSIGCYPNPAAAAATLAVAGLPAAAQVQATLLDVTGRVVGRHVLGACGGSLPLAGLAPGLYVVQLGARDGAGQALGPLPGQRLHVE